MSEITSLLKKAVELEASDVHIKIDRRPFLRVHGMLQEDDSEPLHQEKLLKIIDEIIPEYLKKRFQQTREIDFSYAEGKDMRFRVNVFYTHGQPALAMRHVKTQIPTFQELHLPDLFGEIALSQRGVVVMTGTTGSGKSTTLAAMINHINMTERRRIITIEDPIEYLFEDIKSVISQREVGFDTAGFKTALKHVMRQDPDVIMVGEMRDAESFMAALTAAETGHLVLTTLHSGTANQAVNRILDFYPPEEQEQIRMALAGNLRAAICQRLIPSLDGAVVPAVEIMINTPTVRKLIEKNKLDVLSAAIETGTDEGMQTFNQAIYKWIKGGQITEEEGMRLATNPETLRMNLKGIFLDESRRILGE